VGDATLETHDSDHDSDRAALKDWDEPSFVELPVASAASGFTGSGADNTIYS
jgi:hypothetical protein